MHFVFIHHPNKYTMLLLNFQSVHQTLQLFNSFIVSRMLKSIKNTILFIYIFLGKNRPFFSILL